MVCSGPFVVAGVILRLGSQCERPASAGPRKDPSGVTHRGEFPIWESAGHS
jgi:hypothetical protein